MRHRSWGAWVALWGLLAGGCASVDQGPELGGIYNRAAQQHGPERVPGT
jgi:hypothetical protein